MSTEYLSYDEILTKFTKKTRCCECRNVIPARSLFWLLSMSEQGAKVTYYITCEACHAQRLEFCTEHFTPTQLLQDLEALRSALPYDSARPWAMLTNAVSLLRQRIANAGPIPRLPTTPTPLRGVRVVRGGLLP